MMSLLPHLPPEILVKIYEYDPTYHRDRRMEVHAELRNMLFLRNSFRNCLPEIILTPWYRWQLLQRFTKKELLQYTKTFHLPVHTRITKARLLTFILWFHLHENYEFDLAQQIEANYFD